MSYYEIIESNKRKNLEISKYLHSEPTPLQTPYVFEIKLEKIDGNINILRIIKKTVEDNLINQNEMILYNSVAKCSITIIPIETMEITKIELLLQSKSYHISNQIYIEALNINDFLYINYKLN